MNHRSPRDRERGRASRAGCSALAVAALLGAAACRPPGAGGPAAALREYVAAVHADDPKRAYALLADPVRRRVTEAEFMERWRAHRPELRAQAQQLTARLRLDTPIPATASVRFADGVGAALTLDDRWRIDSGVSVAPPAATPLEALHGLAAALERRSFEAVLKLLARPLRKSLETEVDDRLSKLKAWLSREPEIEVTGDRARVRFDPRYRIELVNEDGQWRVIDYN